jgi:hypothetical protein
MLAYFPPLTLFSILLPVLVVVHVLDGLTINIHHELMIFEYEEDYGIVVIILPILGSLPINILQELPLFEDEHEYEYDDECM